jgi:hypothetical protein
LRSNELLSDLQFEFLKCHSIFDTVLSIIKYYANALNKNTQPFIPFSETESIIKTSEKIGNFAQQNGQSNDGGVRENLFHKAIRETLFDLVDNNEIKIGDKLPCLDEVEH